MYLLVQPFGRVWRPKIANLVYCCETVQTFPKPIDNRVLHSREDKKEEVTHKMVATETMDETHLRRLNICTEIKARNIKSQRNVELEALRMKGLAKERRNWLNECM